MKKHKVWKVVLFIVAAVLIVSFAAIWSMFGTEFKAANSIKKLDEGLYTLEYKGDYGFNDFLAQGGAESDEKMAEYIASFLSHGLWKDDTSSIGTGNYGCSTLTVKSDEDEVLFGRNYDWDNCDAMIVHTIPETGYESVSTCCLNFLGFGAGWKPEGMENKFLALASIYVPLDGMNEKGLCIADLMAGDMIETHQKTDRPDLTTTAAIRLILDKAATVDEAVNLLSKYDMNSAIGTAHHYAISDASGKSVVVEYVDGKMHITDTPVVTNFYLTKGDKYGIGSDESHVRYDRLIENFEENDGIMKAEDVKNAMASVAQSNFPGSEDDTQWTIVFEAGSHRMNLYWKENYDKPYIVTLENN